MDWSTVNTAAQRHDPPSPEPIERCWRMEGPSGKILSAGVYRNGELLEVRAGYGEDDVLRSERVQSIGDGQARCAEWRQALLAQGSWRELPVDS